MRALIRTLVCAALVLLALAAPAAAQPKTDVVILVNGDKFTGEI
jgi:putative cell wall-binding protein